MTAHARHFRLIRLAGNKVCIRFADISGESIDTFSGSILEINSDDALCLVMMIEFGAVRFDSVSDYRRIAAAQFHGPHERGPALNVF